MPTIEQMLVSYEPDVIAWAKVFGGTIRRSELTDTMQELRIHLYLFLLKFTKNNPGKWPDMNLIRGILKNKLIDLWRVNQSKRNTMYANPCEASDHAYLTYEDTSKDTYGDTLFDGIVSEIYMILTTMECLIFSMLLEGMNCSEILDVCSQLEGWSSLSKNKQKNMLYSTIQSIQEKAVSVLEYLGVL